MSHADDARERWPALMDLPTASAYLCLAPGSLVAFLRRSGVDSVDLGARLRRWRKRDLDDLLARTPALGPAPAPCVSGRSGEDALAAVERRTFARVKARRRRTVQ